MIDPNLIYDIDLSDLIYDVEVNLQALGLTKLQRGFLDGEPTSLRRWTLVDRPVVNQLLADSILEADGPEELAQIKAESAIAANPYLAFRSAMSPEALRILNLKLVEKKYSS
jgi:hypothetical protein